MAVRPIDLDQLMKYPLRRGSEHCDEKNADPRFLNGVESILEWAQTLPTLTQPNEPLTETGYFKASGDLALCRCPFCGSEDVVYERYLHTAGYRWRVVCTSCMASIDPGYAQQRSMVQRMWNTRAPILSAGEMVMLEGME